LKGFNGYLFVISSVKPKEISPHIVSLHNL